MKKERRWLYSILIPVIIVGLFVLSFFDLTRNLKADLRDASYRTLWETANEQASHIKATLLSRFRLLETAISFLPEDALTADSPASAAAALSAMPEDDVFHALYYIDESGAALASDGTALDCSNEAFFAEAMSGRRASSYIASEDLFAFAVPVWYGGQVVGAAAGTVSSAALSALLGTQLFDGASVFRILSEDGTVILDGQSGAYGDTLSALFDAGSIDQAAADAIMQNLKSGTSGTLEAQSNGVPLYGVYTRLGMNGWYLLHTVPADSINGDKMFIRNNILAFGAEVILIVGILAILLVVSEKRRSRRLKSDRDRLQQSEESYRLLNQLSEGIMFEGSHPDGTLHFNQTYAETFGREPFITCVADLEKENPYIYEKDAAAYRCFANDLLAHANTASAEFRIYDGAHEPRWFRSEYLTALDSAHRPGRFVGKLMDIDCEKRTLQRLTADAARDPLTKLLNRTAMEQHVDDYLSTDGKTGLHAFFMIDLDDFKQINDTYGHIEGDKLLQEVADQLRALFRTSDFLCRMGGDEFSIFLCNINSRERIAVKAQALIDAITQLGRRYETCPRISVSIGIAIPVQDGASYATLYRSADTALYRAKHSGKSTYLFCA